MTRGRESKLVGQTGEYLVAAELCRRGLIATTFTGNVPHFDILAADEAGRHVSVQVKTSRSGSWQFGNITQYCDIAWDSTRQIVGQKKQCPVERLVVVFVRIDDAQDDRFYVVAWDLLRDLLVGLHESYLSMHGGTRPKKWDSLHCSISESDLEPYRDQWDTVTRHLR